MGGPAAYGRALLMPGGDGVDVMAMVTVEDNPDLFSRRDRKSGAAPKARKVGRLGKRDVDRWGPSFGCRDVVVCIYIDATPGREQLEVRFKPGLLEDNPAAASVMPGAGVPAPAPTAVPAGWFPDPGGEHRLRYWDGTQWTQHVAQ